MIPYWPSDLPQRVLRKGFSRGFADGRLSTKNDAGPTKVRQRFSSAIKPVEVAIAINVNGVARLERFWIEDTRKGSLPFLMPDQMNDGLVLSDGNGSALLTETGLVLINTSWWLVMFGEGAPKAVNTAGAWYEVSFPLSVLP